MKGVDKHMKNSIIYSFGFFLPNGIFELNEGGHAKSAWRFCNRYPEMVRLKESQYPDINYDDFLLMSGAAAVAGNNGNRCLRIVKQHPAVVMQEIVKAYKNAGFIIYDCWKLEPNLYATLMHILEEDAKKCVLEETIIIL